MHWTLADLHALERDYYLELLQLVNKGEIKAMVW